MDLWRATNQSCYEPFSDKFDRIVDVEDLASAERAIELVKFIAHYKAGRIERPAMPEDNEEYLITLRNEQRESELVTAIPRGTPRDHLFRFVRDAQNLEASLAEDFANLGIDPTETSVTFLAENSGSTRGLTAYHMAMSTIETCKALENLGVETAVLGYTTNAWKGGKSREKWLAEGKPNNPGRLEDLLHIIYKRPNELTEGRRLGWLHMLADPKLKRENIFGEGLMWGAAAAATSTRENKVLLHVVHKPNSVSDTTFSSNIDAEQMLMRHQEAIISEIDDAGLLSLATVVLSPGDANLPKLREHRARLGKILVMSEGTGKADETLAAFKTGLVAGLERTLELKSAPARPI